MTVDKSKICSEYFSRLGRTVRLVRTDGSEEQFPAVIRQMWRKNKSKFEDVSGKIGMYYNDYYTYFGPSDYDITALSDNDYIECGNDRYFFVRQEKVVVGDTVQYYAGILKRIIEEN